MTLDEIKRRFAEEVKIRAYDDRYIDKNEELAILQFAIQNNVTVESGRSALQQVCEQQGYVLESVVLKQAKDMMEQFASNDGVISEKEFTDAVGIVKRATQGKRNDVQCKRMVLQVMADNAYQPKTGMFTNWHARVKKEVGLA